MKKLQEHGGEYGHKASKNIGRTGDEKRIK
jgi:hypothetical protein